MRTIWEKVTADWGGQKDHDIIIVLVVLTVKKSQQKITTKYINLKLKGNVSSKGHTRGRPLNMTASH